MRRTDQRNLETMEADYAAMLRAALERCAAGQWGLFGQNDRAIATLGRYGRERFRSAETDDLLELGTAIESCRRRLGYHEPFAPHDRLIQLRAGSGSNTPGEPKLATQWLSELGGRQ